MLFSDRLMLGYLLLKECLYRDSSAPMEAKDQEILMGIKERYPELYKELIAAYYRRLAEESGK